MENIITLSIFFKVKPPSITHYPYNIPVYWLGITEGNYIFTVYLFTICPTITGQHMLLVNPHFS